MTVTTVQATNLTSLLDTTLEHFTDEDWYRLNRTANETIKSEQDLEQAEPVTLSAEGYLLSGFATLFRAIQLDAAVAVHQA